MYTVINEIIGSSEENKLSYFQKRHGEMFARFPALLKMACEPNLDKGDFMNKFTYYLEMRTKVEKQELTLDQADVKVGTRLGKEYIPAHFK